MFHIDAFIDYLDVERGLSPRTLVAYRKDIERLAEWLEARGTTTIAEAGVDHLRAYTSPTDCSGVTRRCSSSPMPPACA